MKITNHYIWLCALWITSTICDSISCARNFIEGNLVVGFVFLVLSVAFAFVSGILLNKAIQIHQHNKACKFLEEIHEFLLEQEIDSIDPFEEIGEGAE